MKKDNIVYNAFFNKNIAFSIRLGRIILTIGSILLCFSGFAHFISFFADLACGRIFLDDPVAWIELILRPILYLFMVFASIGGVSFSINKGPFISLAALTAIISGIFFLIWLLFDLQNLIIGGDWSNFAVSFTSIDLFLLIYFIGWFLAKDYID
ncbi:MAG TPA: hypothetical protein DEF61_05715 [Firmicutes bacterium]|nr:hypothetical protein [Bacillota bacterium]HBX25717.1 hypothetical protein [Bacillota bacterium]